MITFTNMEVVGLIPTFLNYDDDRPVKEQIDTAYQHGGGWKHFDGFTLIHAGSKHDKYSIEYEGDSPNHELSRATLRDELLVFFEHAWLAIIQKDGSFEVSRLD